MRAGHGRFETGRAGGRAGGREGGRAGGRAYLVPLKLGREAFGKDWCLTHQLVGVEEGGEGIGETIRVLGN